MKEYQKKEKQKKPGHKQKTVAPSSSTKNKKAASDQKIREDSKESRESKEVEDVPS